jgi:peptidoglycan/xylan/chitin deacetylase (PgdA/CDA1 family)
MQRVSILFCTFRFKQERHNKNLMHSDVMNIPILMYHSIAYDATRRFKQFTVPPTLFAEQMAYLSQHGYTSLTVTQFISARLRDALPTRPVLLTFDDGFADFASDALPILQRYGFTATLYVATGYVGATSRWLLHEGEARRPMLTWSQLLDVSRCGIECGAHSHTHHQLDVVSPVVANEEIMSSKCLLEQHLGVAVSSFAYPFGYYTSAVKALVCAAGFTSACAVKHAMSSVTANPFSLARLMVKANGGIDAFATLLAGRLPSLIEAFYVRSRTPFFQIARRGTALLTRSQQRGIYKEQV